MALNRGKSIHHQHLQTNQGDFRSQSDTAAETCPEVGFTSDLQTF